MDRGNSLITSAILRLLDHEYATADELINRARHYFGSKSLEIILDDTVIRKTYSKFIEGSSDTYDTVQKQMVRSICQVVAMLSDGKTALPVLHQLLINKEFCSEYSYVSKTKIAQGLIAYLKGKLSIKLVLMDGAYATVEMIRWCKEQNIPFEMRFHSNRKIALDPTKPDSTIKITACKELILKERKRCRTTTAVWHGETIYITSVKYVILISY